MKYYLRQDHGAFGLWYLIYDGRFEPYNGKYWNQPMPFDTIEAAKSKGQELGGTFQIVNEGFEVVWPITQSD